MNHQQTLIGRLLCDLHELSFFLPMAFNVQALYSVLASEVHFCTLCSVMIVDIFWINSNLLIMYVSTVFYEKDSKAGSFPYWRCESDSSPSATSVMFSMKYCIRLPVFWNCLLVLLHSCCCYYNCYQLLPRLDHWSLSRSFIFKIWGVLLWLVFIFFLCPAFSVPPFINLVVAHSSRKI